MNKIHGLLVSLAVLASAAMPLGAQTAGAPEQAAVKGQSADQAELSKLTTENSLEDQRLKKKLRLLNDQKEELRAKYDLAMQEQKLKTAALETELNNLSAENKLTSEKYQKTIKDLQSQLDKASLDNKLADEKRKAEVSAMEGEYQKLASQNKLASEQSKALMAKQNDDLQKLGLDNRLADETNKKVLGQLSQQLAALKAANDLKTEQLRELSIADMKEKSAIEMEMKRMDLAERKLKMEKLAMDSRMDKLRSDIELRTRKDEWKKESNTEPAYTDKPFNNKKLIISDRRITLNGPIFTGVADYVTERIHFFNNISTQPIFIVIDRSPGGSVMEGYRILKAMQASRAPISVVVKSYAASMAATIATLADKSYIYPNAIMLHHQMSTMNWGNMTQLKEQLELAREWEKRLAVPIADRMGISLEEFRKKMYEKNSDGDWEEFGDKAVGYKWITSVVDEIEETGFTKNPDAQVDKPRARFALDEKLDEAGRRYVNLPRLEPFDFYYIYNPDRYYR